MNESDNFIKTFTIIIMFIIVIGEMIINIQAARKCFCFISTKMTHDLQNIPNRLVNKL